MNYKNIYLWVDGKGWTLFENPTEQDFKERGIKIGKYAKIGENAEIGDYAKV